MITYVRYKVNQNMCVIHIAQFNTFICALFLVIMRIVYVRYFLYNEYIKTNKKGVATLTPTTPHHKERMHPNYTTGRKVKQYEEINNCRKKRESGC